MIIDTPNVPCSKCGHWSAKLVITGNRRTVVHLDWRLPNCELPK